MHSEADRPEESDQQLLKNIPDKADESSDTIESVASQIRRAPPAFKPT